MGTVSELDKEYFRLGRRHIEEFLQRTAAKLAHRSGRLLDIGPQDRNVVRIIFSNFQLETFDICDDHKPDVIGDITKHNECIPDGAYDCVLCLDVLEHTLDPFGAVRELYRILKDGGYLLVSAPFNFRIHGPIPDCWRFTEHGWKVLLRQFEILEIDILEAPGRELFPIHYNILARKVAGKETPVSDLKFRFI
jgi:SAM-dependent methyltransferase